MHERYSPREAIQFVKDCEQFELLEDPLSPGDIAWFRQMRSQCATPIAMGGCFNSPHEWTPLIVERLIDYIRGRVSQVGGVTPARQGVRATGRTVRSENGMARARRRLAGRPYGARPPGPLSYNFGIQEGGIITGRLAEMFTGCATFKDGYLWVSDAPGWGIEVNEKLAANYPYGTNEGARGSLNGGWGDLRLTDGTVIKQ